MSQGRAEGRAGRERAYLPRLVAWEVTRRCYLKCKHCRAEALDRPYPGELSTAECLAVLKSIAAFAKPIVILTGGEPMVRDDIFVVARYGVDLGLRMVMAPCGKLVTPETVELIKEAGIERISISLDGATAKTHDRFRAVAGAFAFAVRATRFAQQGGLPFQINTTVTKHNVAELPQILNLAVELGAVAFHPFLLVPTGRGKLLADQEIDPAEYERVLHWIYEQRDRIPLQLKPTCAPHYYRIFRQREKQAGRPVSPETHGLDAMTKGCMGGQSFAFISHRGKVQICGFLEAECGDLRKAGLDFKKIWDTSPVFREMRDLDGYHGRCGYCEYRSFCGGCRARAFATSGHYLDEEPFCVYQPVARPRLPQPSSMAPSA